MTMTRFKPGHHFRLWSLIIGCAAASAVLPGGPLQAQTIACLVGGEPVTNLDVEQRSKLNFLTTHKQMPRQEAIDELINDKVKIKEGKKFGVDPTGTDIDQSYAQMAQRMRITPDQLTKSLEVQGVRPETLKARLKAEMVWTSLVRGRYKESLQVSERDINEQAKEAGDSGKVEAFEYKMQPIVLLVPRGAAPAVFESRKREADALRERVTSCASANSYFKSMQNATIREAVTKTSNELAVPLREMLDKTAIGHLTPPEITKQGIEMVALCERKSTTVDSPKKQEIRQKIIIQKFEAKQKSYLAEIRKAAMIECR
jgi:peptidyl-prolyl cis-trans isomerase SurA